jgi:hypothetical protein
LKKEFNFLGGSFVEGAPALSFSFSCWHNLDLTIHLALFFFLLAQSTIELEIGERVEHKKLEGITNHDPRWRL